MLTGSTVLRAKPSPDGSGWDVFELGGTRPLLHASDQDSAVRRARAQLTAGGTLEIYDLTSRLTATEQIPAPGKQPWWYTSSRPWTWVLLGLMGFNVALALIRLDQALTFTWWLSLVGVLCLLVAVAFVIASRIRDRRSTPPPTNSA